MANQAVFEADTVLQEGLGESAEAGREGED